MLILPSQLVLAFYRNRRKLILTKKIMAEKIHGMFLSGFSFYKKTILELVLLCFITWGNFVMGDTMTEKQWNELDKFSKRRYYIAEIMAVAVIIKGFFSSAVGDSKAAQKKEEDSTKPSKVVENKMADKVVEKVLDNAEIKLNV